MKKILFCLCVLCLLCGCEEAGNSSVVSGVTVQKGETEKKALVNPNSVIARGEGIEIKYGKTFDKSDYSYKSYQYIYINGHRYIKWSLRQTESSLDGFVSIFEDGECPKCKQERKEELEKMKQEIINSIYSSSMLR